MGDDKTGPILHDLNHCFLNILFRLRIKGGRCFIKNQYFWILYDGSGNGYPLSLTSREEDAPFSDDGFKFLWSRDMNMATPSISQLFDETKLKKAFAELTAADPTFGQNYNDFYFPWSYKQNIEKVKKKAEDSSLDNSILKLFDPHLLITKVNYKFNSNINDALNVDYSSFLLNGEFYAISTKYMNYFSKNLGIRNAIT